MGFQIGYQTHRGKGRPVIRENWRVLHDIDAQLIEKSYEPICIETLEDDLKLMAWRPRFLEMGARAFMAYNVSPGNAPEGIILVTDSITRRWSQLDKKLIPVSRPANRLDFASMATPTSGRSTRSAT